MDRKLDMELNSLKETLLAMCGLVREMVSNCINALIYGDENLLPRVDENEKKVNRLQVDIDEQVLKTIALHQPAASDLRFLLGVSKINAELERIGDHAVNISSRVIQIIKSPPIKPFVDLPVMTDITLSMFRESLAAFIESDVDKAKMTLLRDDEVDRLKYKKISDLKDIMKKNPSKIDTALELIIIVSNLEKIADHATNIAEAVIFVAKGKDVRHHFAE